MVLPVICGTGCLGGFAFTRCIAKSDNNLWIATYGGLYRQASRRIESVGHAEQLGRVFAHAPRLLERSLEHLAFDAGQMPVEVEAGVRDAQRHNRWLRCIGSTT